MNKKSMLIVNAGISVNEFEKGFYICPDTKNYTFRIIPDIIAAHYKSEIKYIAIRRAWAKVKLVGEEYIIGDGMKCNIKEKDIVEELLIRASIEAEKLGLLDRDARIGHQVFLLDRVVGINAPYKHSFHNWSKLYMEVYSKEVITFDKIVEKFKNKDFNGYNFRNINLDNM